MAEGVLALTAQIVSALATRNAVEIGELPGLIRDVHRVLSGLEEETSTPSAESATQAVVPASRSVFPTHILCMECGKKMSMLKRHLNTEHGLTVGQYRSKYNLPSVYPMVAPEYARVRSAIAKDMGLGKTRGEAPERGVGKKV